MGMDRPIKGKKYRILTDKINKTWDVISFWTAASDVTVEETGNNAEEEFKKINQKIGVADGLVIDTRDLEAPDFDETKKYTVGDVVKHNGLIWRCTVNMTSPENWIESHWELITSIPFRFGISPEGKYGYYKVGADSVTPFNNGSGIELVTSGGGKKGNYTFTQDYQNCYVMITGFARYYFKYPEGTNSHTMTIKTTLNEQSIDKNLVSGNVSLKHNSFAPSIMAVYRLENIKMGDVLSYVVDETYQTKPNPDNYADESSYTPTVNGKMCIIGA